MRTKKDRDLTSLGLDEITAALVSRAATPGGKAACASLAPASDQQQAQARLEETGAALILVTQRPEFVIEECEDVEAPVAAAEKKRTLRGGQLRLLLPVLRAGEVVKDVFDSMDDDRNELAPIMMEVPVVMGLAEMIDESIDEDGSVRSDATPAIERLFNTINSLRRSIRERAEKFLTDPAVAPLLQDSFVTLRDNRFVLPVRAEEKSRLDGIIHGSSNSGQTYFIEPKALVDLNNRLRTAQIELEEEINRFLAELTAMVADEAEAIRAIYTAICRLDAFVARARLAADLSLTKPLLGGVIDLKDASNPVMLLEGKQVVSNYVLMPEGARALVISGPNTGGKTVLLKLIGLCAAMAAMGLFIPAGEGSSIPFYRSIFADIGDSQSLADDLSSFSGHILAVRRVLDQSGPGCLALLDELMINTDPKEGSALAMATLEALVEKGANVVVTTHYHDLKLLAQTDSMYANVSMDFDSRTARPTYRLIAGAAGESSAISVAENLSLDGRIIVSAKAHLQGSDERTEHLLAQLREKKDQMDQAELEMARSLESVRKMREETQALRDEAAALKEETAKGSKMKIGADVRAARREIAQLVEEARAAAGSKEKLSLASRKLATVETNVAKASIPEARIRPENLKAGDTAYVIPLQQKGVVAVAASNGKIEVTVGRMSVTVGVDEVVGLGHEKLARPEPVRWEKEGGSEAVEEGEPLEVHLRGMRAEAALEEVERTLDTAMSNKARLVRIIHGKGTGALRQAVREYLVTSPYVKDFRLGEPKEGGEGATVVTLR
ncbi:MAG: Smr/MutS family protein [Nitrospinota bacterium]|nr:Smr/MutS family protein [Nitrospinota bacterium]